MTTPVRTPSARLLLWALGSCIVLAACSPDSSSRAVELGGEPCLDSGFLCLTLEVPLDHFDAADQSRLEVEFAVRPASKRQRGVLVVVEGGPGGSGLASAPGDVTLLPHSLLDSHDVVYFDQRGVGLSDELACPESGIDDDPEWQFFDSWTQLVTEYVEGCVAELARPDLLPFLGTDQAIRDLELFREAMGYRRIVLYGRSYGTSFIQAYASAFPESVHRMILDSPIDLTRDDLERTREQIQAFRWILDMTFDACDTDSDCRADMGTATRRVYSALLNGLRNEAAAVRVPRGTATEDAVFTAEDLEDAAFTLMYDEWGRGLFVRALGAYSLRNDLVPLVRLSEVDWFGTSTELHSAIRCMDAVLPGDTVAEQLDHLARAWAEAGASDRGSYLSDLLCAVWPTADPSSASIDLSHATSIPTLILASTVDPATPHSGAVSLAEHFDRARLLTIEGGSHVLFGKGDTCVDDAVINFVETGRWPRDESCEASMIGDYAPLLRHPAEHEIVDNFWWAYEAEVLHLFALYSEEDAGVLAAACDHGGEVVFTETEAALEFRFDNCELVGGIVMTGSGTWESDTRRSRHEVSTMMDGCSYWFDWNWDDEEPSSGEHCP